MIGEKKCQIAVYIVHTVKTHSYSKMAFIYLKPQNSTKILLVRKMKKYALIVENNKELIDYISILNELSQKSHIFVKIIFLAEIYKDLSQYESLKNIRFEHEKLVIKNSYDISFSKMPLMRKLSIVMSNRRQMFKFIQDCEVLFSGIQTIFERSLFNDIKNSKINIKVISYHRHLLFDDGVNTNLSNNKHYCIKKNIAKFIGLEWIFIDNKGAGFSDKYLVLGDVNKKYLISKGVQAEDIYVVGSLEYDNIPSITKKYETQSVCYITGAFEWIGDYEGDYYQDKKINEYINTFYKRNFDVWIRVHPRENIEKYNALKQRFPFIHIQKATGKPILDDLGVFDILVGGISTALFEASLLNNDNYILFALHKDEFYRYSDLINSINLPYSFSIEDSISSISSGKRIQEKNVIFYDKEESALSRISNIIEGILNV